MRLGMHERKNLYVRATMKRRKKKKKIAPRDFMISRLQFSNLRKSDFINFSYPNQMLGSGHRRASIRLYEGPWVPGSKMCVSKYNCAMHMFSGLGSFISLGLGCLSNPSFYYPGVEGSKGSLKTHYSCWTCRNVGVTSRPRHHIPHWSVLLDIDNLGFLLSVVNVIEPCEWDRRANTFSLARICLTWLLIDIVSSPRRGYHL